MNKRQAKKISARDKMFSEYQVSSYKEKRALDRNYHEYEILYKRTIKQCKKCKYFINENLCGMFIMGFPCVKDL